MPDIAGSPGQSAGGTCKVLVVEDEHNIASLLEHWLSESFEVRVASTGTMALQKTREETPDIILMDIGIPDINGYEVTKALQVDPATAGIPVIVMTARHYDDHTIRMILAEKNVAGFLNKPFRAEDIQKQIRKALSGEKGALVQSFRSTETPVLNPQRSSGREIAVLIPSPGNSSSSPVSNFERGNSFKLEFFRHVKKVLAGALFLFVVLFSGGEWLLRRMEALSGRELFDPPVVPSTDEGIPYKFEPGTTWVRDGIVYRWNAWGLRNGEISLVPEPSVKRVLVLGGTFVFGERVSQEETVVYILEKKLNGFYSGSARFEVINAGLWGFPLEAQWNFFEKYGAQLNPDVFVWVGEENSFPGTRGISELLNRRWLSWGIFSKIRWIRFFRREFMSRRDKGSRVAIKTLLEKAVKHSKIKKSVFIHIPTPVVNGKPISGRILGSGYLLADEIFDRIRRITVSLKEGVHRRK